MKKGYWFILCGIVVLWFTSWGLINTFIIETDRGAFGDMFGAVNALFSGLALAGVVIAIFMQREELSLQREELKLTREEMKRQAEAQERSSEALTMQVETMKKSAILNAIVIGIENCNSAIKSRINSKSAGGSPYSRQRTVLIKYLDSELNHILEEYEKEAADKVLEEVDHTME